MTTQLDPIARDLADWDGSFTLDATCDLALADGPTSLQRRLLTSLITTKGTVPYFPDDGADGAASEGGPALDGGALARRAKTQLLRDPDVLSVTEVAVRSDTIAGLVKVAATVTSRSSPASPQTLNFGLPVT